MSSAHEREVILSHALLNEENLSVAAMIGSAYPVLCGRVIVGFLEALEKELAPRLGQGWQLTVNRDPEAIGGRWVELLAARYLGHLPGVSVVLGGDETGYPKSCYLAIRCDAGAVVQPGLSAAVKSAVDSEYAPGRSTEVSVWYRYIDKAYSGWGSEESILQLYRKGEAVTYFAGHVEKVARVMEKALRSAASA